MTEEIFVSQISPDGRLAGVYEHDGEVGHLYLYDMGESDDHKIICALRVDVGPSLHQEADVAIRWTSDTGMVGVFMTERLRAAIRVSDQALFGGDLAQNEPLVDAILCAFKPTQV